MTTQAVPSQALRHRFSVEEYHRMGESGFLDSNQPTELLNGEIYDMSPINSLHAAAVKRLNRLFSRMLGETVIIGVQDPIALSDFSEPQPDIAVLRYRSDFYAGGHPRPDEILLLVEVADSSVFKDRNVKIPLYGKTGIPEVWLLDLEAQQVEVFLGPQEEGYAEVRLFGRGETVVSATIPGLTVDSLLGS